jgi:hypothetical protein
MSETNYSENNISKKFKSVVYNVLIDKIKAEKSKRKIDSIFHDMLKEKPEEMNQENALKIKFEKLALKVKFNYAHPKK